MTIGLHIKSSQNFPYLPTIQPFTLLPTEVWRSFYITFDMITANGCADYRGFLGAASGTCSNISRVFYNTGGTPELGCFPVPMLLYCAANFRAQANLFEQYARTSVQHVTQYQNRHRLHFCYFHAKAIGWCKFRWYRERWVFIWTKVQNTLHKIDLFVPVRTSAFNRRKHRNYEGLNLTSFTDIYTKIVSEWKIWFFYYFIVW